MLFSKLYDSEYCYPYSFTLDKCVRRANFITIVHILHPGKASVSKKDVQERLAKKYKSSPDCVVCHKMHIQFGGGRSTAIALIYDSIDNLKKFEPKYRQIRKGLLEKSKVTRRMKKGMKNRMKRVRGIAKAAAAQQGGKKK